MMTIQLFPDEIIVKSETPIDTLTISSNYVFLVKVPVNSPRRKKELVNTLVCSLWKTKKAREKYSI